MRFEKIFNREAAWTQDAQARDLHGNAINLDWVDRNNTKEVKKIYSWSLYGALTWYFPYDSSPHKREAQRIKLRKAIERYTGKNMSISEFNNSPSTTFADIRKVITLIR